MLSGRYSPKMLLKIMNIYMIKYFELMSKCEAPIGTGGYGISWERKRPKNFVWFLNNTEWSFEVWLVAWVRFYQTKINTAHSCNIIVLLSVIMKLLSLCGGLIMYVPLHQWWPLPYVTLLLHNHKNLKGLPCGHVWHTKKEIL